MENITTIGLFSDHPDTEYPGLLQLARSHGTKVVKAVSFDDKLAYLPAFLWAVSSFYEAQQGKVGARKGASAGEGADMMAHHYINLFLTSASYLAGRQVRELRFALRLLAI